MKYYYIAFWRGSKIYIVSNYYKTLLDASSKVNSTIEFLHKNYRNEYLNILYGLAYGVICLKEKITIPNKSIGVKINTEAL